MMNLEGSDHYETVVDRIVEEYEEQLIDEVLVIQEIANAAIAGTTVIHDEPTVLHSGELWGERIEATGGEALNPYEVLMYSDAELPNHTPVDSSTEKLAAACLAKDIAEVRRSIRAQ
jgi:hypothetical protein